MFEKFRKIPRFNSEVVVTEKIDGTNAQIFICDRGDAVFEVCDPYSMYQSIIDELCMGRQGDLMLFAGSRKRYLTVDDDNFGFANWCHVNAEDLFRLGPGRHYGEWWGNGIQRNYGLEGRRLSMFNPKWADQGPECVSTPPILDTLTTLDAEAIEWAMQDLKVGGSQAAPGFMDPEGVVIYHTGANHYYKQTFDFDEGKWSEDQTCQ